MFKQVPSHSPQHTMCFCPQVPQDSWLSGGHDQPRGREREREREGEGEIKISRVRERERERESRYRFHTPCVYI
jgi:hypothetical protein